MPAWRKLAEQFRDPLVYLLLVAVAVSLVAWLLEGAQDVPFGIGHLLGQDPGRSPAAR